MSKQALGMLGLAARSRKTVTGESVLKYIQNGKAKLVIITDTCGENGRKKLIDKCIFYKIPYVFMNEIEVNQAIGMWNRKSVAVVDEGFAQKLHTCLKG